MAGKRKQYSAAFKAQVALAALKGDRTVNELAGQFGVHPTLIHGWKKQLLAQAETLFANGSKASHGRRRGREDRAVRADRPAQDGAGVAEKKSRTAPPECLRPLVDPDHPELSVRRQCELLGLIPSRACTTSRSRSRPRTCG